MQTSTREEVLNSFFNKGATKGELKVFFNKMPRNFLAQEIWETLTEVRRITLDEAKRVVFLKGSEVKNLYNKLK